MMTTNTGGTVVGGGLAITIGFTITIKIVVEIWR
jgi:hypothetical protein